MAVVSTSSPKPTSTMRTGTRWVWTWKSPGARPARRRASAARADETDRSNATAPQPRTASGRDLPMAEPRSETGGGYCTPPGHARPGVPKRASITGSEEAGELRPLEHDRPHHLAPAVPLEGREGLRGDLHLLEQRVHQLVDRAHEELVGVADAVGGGSAQDRHLEEQVVALHPVRHEALVGLLAPAGQGHVGVVVERAAVADHDFVVGGRADLLRHLRHEDPGLGLERGLAIDGQRAQARDFLDHVHVHALALERACEVVAEGGLPHAVRPDERDFHRVFIVWGGTLRRVPPLGPTPAAPAK